MGKWEFKALAEINFYKGKSIVPMNSPNETYELYSVPSWDNKYPEIINGADIGSSKQSVEKDDVLICKINPRINRVWVVEKHTNHPLIASSEWIVIRNKDIDSHYLSKYFQSPFFRDQLISEQSGIGGSLTRAQPKRVSAYKIPLPPLPIQHKIADVLDKASALIEMRKAQIEKLDLLIKSQFVEMFGDLQSNSRKWDVHSFSFAAKIDTKMTTDFKQYALYPHIGIESIEKETGKILNYKLVKDSDLKSGKYLFDERHLIYSKIRPNLNKLAKPNFKGLCSADAYPLLPTKNSNREFLTQVLRSDFFLDYILAFCGRTNIPKVNKEQLEGFMLPVPPKSLQDKFALIVMQAEEKQALLEQSLKVLETHYQSLVQKCFSGEIF